MIGRGEVDLLLIVRSRLLLLLLLLHLLLPLHHKGSLVISESHNET